MTPQLPVAPPTMILPPSPLAVGQAMTSALDIMRRRFGMFVALAFVPGLIMVAIILGVVLIGGVAMIGAFAGADRYGTTGNVGGAIVLMLVLMLVAMLAIAAIQIKAYGMIVLLAHETALGRRPDYQALNEGTRGIVARTFVLILVAGLAAVVVAGVLMGIFAAAAMPLAAQGRWASGNLAGLMALYFLFMLAFSVAGLYFSTRWLYCYQGLAIEGRDGFAALGSSWRLTKNDFWRTLGWYLLADVAVFVVVLIFETVGTGLLAPFTYAMAEGNNPLAGVGGVLTFLYAVLLAVMQGLLVPLMLAYTTVMYIDQRRRNELAAAGVPLQWQPQQYPTQPGYGAPTPGYGAPTQSGYGTPTPGYGAPTPGYGTPAQSGYGAPTQPASGGPGTPSAYGWAAPAGGSQPAQPGAYTPPAQPGAYTPPAQPGAYTPPAQPDGSSSDPLQRPTPPSPGDATHP